MQRGLFLLVPLALVGCGGNLPPLPKYDLAGEQHAYDVRPATIVAERLANDYATHYETVGKNNRLANLPIIGAAMAAAVLTLVSPASGTQAIGLIGIGAGGYQVGRSSIAPASMPMLYAKGHAAMGCIRAEAAPFLINSPTAERPYEDTDLGQFEGARTNLTANIAAAEQGTKMRLTVETETAEMAGRSEAERKADANARQARLATAMTRQSELQDMLIKARALLADTAADVQAGQVAGVVMRTAVDAVAQRVITKGLEGTVVDYRTLLGLLTPAAPLAGESTPSEPKDMAASITQLEQINSNLAKAINSLNQAKRPYAAALDRVKACPATVG